MTQLNDLWWNLPTVKDSSTGRLFLAIIPHICRLICTTQNSTWGIFTDVLHKKFTPKMSNHSLVSGSPVLPVLCWNWDRPAAPVHTNHSDTSEAWIGNSVSYLQTFSNITQIFTHFLQVLMVYKKVYNVSRKYQENWNKEHPINNQQKSHPFNVSDKYHVCLGSSTIKTDLQASKFKQQNWLRSCDPQSNLRVALASQQLNIITTRGKPGSQSWKASRNA